MDKPVAEVLGAVSQLLGRCARGLALFGGTVVLTLVGGCTASGMKLMPAPAFVDTEAYEAAAQVAYARSDMSEVLEIFYASDRSPPETPGSCDYSRVRGDRLRLGTAKVSVGDPDWSASELHEHIKAGEQLTMHCQETDEFGALYSTLPPTEQAGIDAYYSTSMEDPVRAPTVAFARQIDAQMAMSGLQEVTIFVSGLATTFSESMEQAAGLHEFVLRRGATVSFAWPVGSSPLSANKDRINGRVSARSLRNLLLLLADQTAAERINIIAYSGGADVAAYALYQLRLSYTGQSPERLRSDLRLGNIILASPDADYVEFRNMLLDGLLDMADSFTAYINPSDKVVMFSEKLSAGAPRLGNPGQVSEVEKQIYRESRRIDFVSPEEGERILGTTDPFGHQYWYRNPWVSSDVLLRLMTDLPPAQRGLIRQEDRAVWDFPEDYPARSEQLMDRFLGAGTGEQTSPEAP